MNFLLSLKQRASLLLKPAMLVWLLAAVGLSSTLFAGWGLWRMTNLTAEFGSHDDRVLVVSVSLKEQVAAYSKLTYDYLLQQDYNKMMQKEKQSDNTRAGIEQGLAELGRIDEGAPAARAMIESIRFNVMQFLGLTEKALELAAEEGSAAKARTYLQETVEPAFKTTEDSLTRLIYSRQQFDQDRFQRMREQALMVIAMLIGLTALGVAVLLSLRRHVLNGGVAQVALPEIPADFMDESPRVQARSLAALAFANRLSRVRKESDDLKKLMQGLAAFAAMSEETPETRASEHDLDTLARQGEKITHAVGRIQHIHDQSKQFIEKLNDMMGGMQKLATDGNVVALNVTIELAKLQSLQGGTTLTDDKNRHISEQIRALATSAAAITGKLAMVLSQLRYTQEDFTRQAGDLADVRGGGAEAFGRLRAALQTSGQSAARLTEKRQALTEYLPMLDRKMVELETQISQLQAIYAAEIEAAGSEGISPQSFKVISGRAA